MQWGVTGMSTQRALRDSGLLCLLTWVVVTWVSYNNLSCMFMCYALFLWAILPFKKVMGEQFLRTIWGAVSRAAVLILPQIKFNSPKKGVLEGAHKNFKSYIKVVVFEAFYSTHSLMRKFLGTCPTLWLSAIRDSLSMSLFLKVLLSKSELCFQGIFCPVTSPSISFFSLNVNVHLLSPEDHSLKASIFPIEVGFRINYRTYANCHKYIQFRLQRSSMSES